MIRLALCIFLMSASPVYAIDLSKPDHKLTPGLATSLTKKQICKVKWGKDERHVTPKMKLAIFMEYGLTGNDDPNCGTDALGRHCEIDHLISRELGGADDEANLWPEPYSVTKDTKWTANQKDRVENRLHKEVCLGTITLEQAQHDIAKDWIAVYKRYFGNDT